MGNPGSQVLEEVNLAQRVAARVELSCPVGERGGLGRQLQVLHLQDNLLNLLFSPFPELCPPPSLGTDWQKSLSNPRHWASSGT